mmetsp:Transcript_1053/g.1712  ORF Transcript_1053/g.1712 Transcript_1053/m.1712 type:complete len:217 (+) Transcript_1053:278-928(+)
MSTMGNARARKYFGCGARPAGANDHAARVQFAKDKYEALKWAPRSHEHADEVEVAAEAGPPASARSGAAAFEKKRQVARSKGKTSKSTVKRSPRMAAVPLPPESPTTEDAASPQPQTEPVFDLLTSSSATLTPMPPTAPSQTSVTTKQPTAPHDTAGDVRYAAQVSSIMRMYNSQPHHGIYERNGFWGVQAPPAPRVPVVQASGGGTSDFFGEFGL